MSDKQALLRHLNYRDIEDQLPEVLPFNRQAPQSNIFITSLGFEARTLAVSAEISKSPAPLGQNCLGIVCIYSTNPEDNEKNRKILTENLSSFCKKIQECPADSPSELSVKIWNCLDEKIEEDKSLDILFDISTASGNLILSVMHSLIDYAKTHPLSLRIAYSEPCEYLPKQEEYTVASEEIVLQACSTGDCNSLHEYGVAEVEINELYPGKNIENRPEFIIAIPSYRTERLSRCLQRLTEQPLADPNNFIHWILGVPPCTDRNYRLEMQRRVISYLLKEMTGHESENGTTLQLSSRNSSEASTLDYRQILKLIIEKIDTEAGKNISVVHMGSKMQAFGISLALGIRSEVTVCYARPNSFNPGHYSEGVGPLWEVNIKNLGRLMGQIKRIGTLDFISRIETQRTGLPNI